MKLASPVFAVSGVNYPFISHHHLVLILNYRKRARLVYRCARELREANVPAAQQLAPPMREPERHYQYLKQETGIKKKWNRTKWVFDTTKMEEWGPQLGRTLHVVNSVRWVDKSSQLHVAVRFKLSKKCAQVPQHPCATERRIFINLKWLRKKATTSGIQYTACSKMCVCQYGLEALEKINFTVKRNVP